MTYSDLQDHLIDLLEDTQVDAAKARMFIARAEPKVDRDMLDIANGGSVPRQKMAPRLVDTTAADGSYALPSDFHRARSVRVGSNIARYVSPEMVPFDTSGDPESGFGEASIHLDYYSLLPALSDTNTSNWLLDIGFDAYLYGSALQWIAWGQDTDNLALWTEFYRDAVRTVKSTHGARPRGGFRRANARYGVYYTIIGSNMYFGRAT